MDDSPNQVLTHAARAAAKQLNKPPFQPPLVAARGAARARRALVRATWTTSTQFNFTCSARPVDVRSK